MGLFSRRKSKTEDQKPPGLLRGTITVGERTWHVTEERRQGPRPQVFVLRADDNEQSQMHVRPLPGEPLRDLDDVGRHAEVPELRWLHANGSLWEARMVVTEDTSVQRIKFVSWTSGVYEGEFPPSERLGLMSDQDLLHLLEKLRNHHAPEAS